MALLIQLIRGRKGLLFAALAASLSTIVITLRWNMLLSLIIDLVSGGRAVPGILLLRAAVICCLSSAAAFGYGALSGWICETMAHDLRMGCARHLTSLSVQEMENTAAGEYLSKLQNELTDAASFFQSGLLPLLDDGLRFIGTFFWMLWMAPALTLTFTLPSFLIIGYTVLSSRAIQRAARDRQEAGSVMNRFADTLVTLFPILRIFDAAPLLCRRFDTAAARWRDACTREERRRAVLMSLSALLSALPLILLLFFGGSQVIAGRLSIGTVYVFINLSGNVSGFLANMPGRLAVFRRFLAGAQRLSPYVLRRKEAVK